MNFHCDVNFEELHSLSAPQDFLKALPITKKQRNFISSSRRQIQEILRGKDQRPFIIVGPCSIHHLSSAAEYAHRLKQLADKVSDKIFIAIRAHFEKPRTLLGWRGMLYDPYLDGSDQVLIGLQKTREFLLELADLELPTATEFLDLNTPLYFADLISWGQIGSRTSASQLHRQLASGLPMPIGFKNNTDGNIKIAAEGAAAAAASYVYPSITSSGRLMTVKSQGNPFGHLVLRGGITGENYSSKAIQEAVALAKKHRIIPRVIIDCSHDNAQGDHLRQKVIFDHLKDQLYADQRNIVGLIIESYLEAGKQPYPADPEKILPEISLTDPCVDWKMTEEMILSLYDHLCQAAPTCPNPQPGATSHCEI